MHISNPIGELKIVKEEAFPNTIGKMAHRYLINEIHRRTDSGRVSACIENGSLAFFEISKILFVSALGKECVIQTTSGEKFVKNSISDLQKQVGDNLIAIHRSYLVNPEFIRSIQRYQITLVDGTELPVPQRKYNELRQKLMKLYMIEED